MKIISVVGARPNFMKIAPLMRELARHPDFDHLLVHTGQHYDPTMSDVFFSDLKLPEPDVHLGVGSGSHAGQTAQVMLGFEPVLSAECPDLVIVVGDVNSTLACSLVAAKLQVPIAHIEAGVRSFDRSMPEEINRVVTDALSSLLFSPSPEANLNLAAEGVPPERIYLVGNVMADTLSQAAGLAADRHTFRRWGLGPGEYAVCTLHRPSNVDDPGRLGALMETLGQVSARLPVILPLHPRTARNLQAFGLEARHPQAPNLILTEPLGYLDFLSLLSEAKLVLTDSGGIQAETSIVGVPCLTLRENTEWPVTVEQGTNYLVGTDPVAVLAVVEQILAGQSKVGRVPELWDGQAAGRIADVLGAWSSRRQSSLASESPPDKPPIRLKAISMIS
jgi:UDP-N-acetylglucosamine 2-epimerase (non-hydrolysing)